MELSNKTTKFPLSSKITLLLNSNSGAIDLVPNKILKNPSPAELNLLKKRKHLDTDKQYDGNLEILKKIIKNQNKNIPYWFYILTTLRCNFNCPICYEKNTSKTKDLNKRTLGSIIELIAKIQKENKIPNKKMFVVLFGGEPLCGDKNVIELILKEIKRKKWKIIIVTNGSLINNYLELFKKYQDVIADFRITIDGPKIIQNQRRPSKGNLDSFTEAEKAIDSLLKEKFTIKMQTILGNGNQKYLGELTKFIQKKQWLKNKNYQWRIEGSHDYANLDPEKDEISEGKMVYSLIKLIDQHPEITDKIKFESFKYLGHIVDSFEWLGNYKTYRGPKFGFCEPRKGFHYVFSTDGNIFHCPRTINNQKYLIGNTKKGLSPKVHKFKKTTILDKKKCKSCAVNTFCGGGCAVQGVYNKDFDCKKYTLKIISEFILLMKEEIASKADGGNIVSINKLWTEI